MKTYYHGVLPGSWDQGGELFAELAQSLCPHLEVADLARVSATLLGSPAYGDWNIEQSTPKSVLMIQATLVAMLVQSFNERANWAMQQDADTEAHKNYVTACSVIKAAIDLAPV